jgi:hypothetical protein
MHLYSGSVFSVKGECSSFNAEQNAASANRGGNCSAIIHKQYRGENQAKALPVQDQVKDLDEQMKADHRMEVRFSTIAALPVCTNNCNGLQADLLAQGWMITDKPQPGDVWIGRGGASEAHTGIVGDMVQIKEE